MIARTRDLRYLEEQLKDKKDMAESIRFQIDDLTWKLENLYSEIEPLEVMISALKSNLAGEELPPKHAKYNHRPGSELHLSCFE